MGTPVFIGDEVSAAGYRLAGVEVHTPAEDQVTAVFRKVRNHTDLILLSVEYARRLPQAELNSALKATRPQLLIVPDIRERLPMRNLRARIRRQLGMRV